MEDECDQWKLYLSQSETWNSEQEIVAPFDRYLSLYPLDLSQWINYARSLYRVTLSEEKTIAVYDKAVAVLAYSPQLWVDYFSFLLDAKLVPSDTVKFAKLIERACDCMCGHSDAADFWRLVFYLIQCTGNLIALIKYYSIVISSPSPYLEDIYDSFMKIKDTISISSAEIKCPGYSSIVGGDIRFIVNLLEEMDNWHDQARLEWLQRAPLEKCIKRRCYIHYLLPSEEIDAWHKYLTFEQRQQKPDLMTAKLDENGGLTEKEVPGSGSSLNSRLEGEWSVREYVNEVRKRRVKMLYERCLIPCATYPEMWRRYCLYVMDAEEDGINLALAIAYKGASAILRRSADMLLFYAALLESNGSISQAREVYSNLLQEPVLQPPTGPSDGGRSKAVSSEGVGPDLEVVCRAADFERRVSTEENDVAAVLAIYDMAMSRSNCRMYINTIICKKANFIGNNAQHGSYAAGIMVIIGRGHLDGINETSTPITSLGLNDISDSQLKAVFQCDIDLSLVKAAYDLLLRFFSCAERDKKVWVLLSSALSMSAYGTYQIPNHLDKQADAEDREGPSKRARFMDDTEPQQIFVCVDDHAKKSINEAAPPKLQCGACPALIHLLKHYCESYSVSVAHILRAESLVDACSYEYHVRLGAP